MSTLADVSDRRRAGSPLLARRCRRTCLRRACPVPGTGHAPTGPALPCETRDVDPDLTAQVAAAAPFTSFLGIELISASPLEMRAWLARDERLCTAGGVLHGGALMGLADDVGGFCAFLDLPEGAAGTATIESKTDFFAPVRGGHVHAASRPLHAGRRTIVVDTELHDDAGRLVARVTQTQAVL